MGTGGNFLNRIPIACALKSRTNKWDLKKSQSFCKTNDIVNRAKQQPTYHEKICTNANSDPGLIFRIYKESKKLDSREQTYPIKNGVRSITKNSQLRN